LTPDTYDIHALDEMLNSEGWRKVARAAIQQRAKHLRDRIATEHFTDLGALHAAQAEYPRRRPAGLLHAEAGIVRQ
jgi:hypothetical protein